MKINIMRLVLPVLALIMAAGCADWIKPEAIKVGEHTDLTKTDKDNAYYQALREYKASDHEISFGWYSRWDEPALTTDGMLMGIPDSMDVVSLWSNSRNLSDARKEDLRFVQDVKGTKVLVCTFVQYVGCGFTPDEYNGSEAEREAFWGWVDGDDAAIASAIAKYAKAISDTVAFYGYDGLDIDFEPNYDGVSGKLDENQGYVEMLFTELSKYFGPKSDSGLMFVVDGEIPNVPPATSVYFDYFVVQAYTVSSGSPSATATGYERNMDSRLASAVSRFSGYLTEEEVTNRYVVTENLESAIDALNGGFYWQTRDGVTQEKAKIPSMLGMAMWQPANGFRKGGFGAYRFDNEATNDPAYKWMRAGIQAQNPASGVYGILVRFSDNVDASFTLKKNFYGNLPSTEVETEFGFLFTRIVPENSVFGLSYEPSYITSGYETIDAERVVLPAELNVAAGAVSSDLLKVKINVDGLAEGDYLIPVKVTLPDNVPFYSDEELVRYIEVSIQPFEPILVSLTGGSGSYPVTLDDNGAFPFTTVEDSFGLSLAQAAPVGLSFDMEYAPEFTSGYNMENNTDFVALEADRVTLPNTLDVEADAESAEAVVSINVDGLAIGKYLAPVKISLPEDVPLTSDGDIVRYIQVKVGVNNVVIDGSAVTGVKIETTENWRLKCYNGYNTSGWSGVWFNDTDEQQAAMFDGSYSTFWYSTSSYFNPGNFIVEMDAEYTISGFRWRSAYGSTYDQFDITDIQISNDREKWESISNETRFTPVMIDNWIDIPLKTPVTTRYFRVIVAASYYVSMYQAEMWAPAE